MNWLKKNRLSVDDPLGSISYDVNSRSSIDQKMKYTKNQDQLINEKMKSHPSFTLQKLSKKINQTPKPPFSNIVKRKDVVRFPSLKKSSLSEFNPQESSMMEQQKEVFYQSQIYRALKSFQTTYMITLARQHFQQTIAGLRQTRNIKLSTPKKQIKLQKKTSLKKTIYLDLDQTLIHTDENSNRYTVKLTFPIETGGSIQAGVRIRPFCKQFLTELSKFAEIIIFTASCASYADVILDHLDPQRVFFAHRLYRNHCTLQKGYYIKDLRVVNRRMQDVAIVDNSAYSFLLQPENGIPILPFYHYAKDKQLQTLLQFLKQLVKYDDVRGFIKKTFFFQSYLKQFNSDAKKIFMKNFKKQSVTLQ